MKSEERRMMNDEKKRGVRELAATNSSLLIS
jgi:hypothetical protein